MSKKKLPDYTWIIILKLSYKTFQAMKNMILLFPELYLIIFSMKNSAYE